MAERNFEASPQNLNKLSLSEAKFILAQGEKALTEISSAGEVLATRTWNVIGVVSGVIVGLIGYAFSRWESKGAIIDALFLTSVLYSVYLIYLTYQLAKNFKGQDYFPVGTNPQKFLIDAFFLAPNESVREVWYYISEIRRCSEKISFNTRKNNHRWAKFNEVLMRLIVSPILALLGYLLLTIFFQSHCLHPS